MTVTWSAVDGARILDLTRLLPGAFATMLLADLGADVIKVESPDGGDPSRRVDAEGFAAINRNKRSLALDLRTADGVAAFLRLVATADAVVESFRPGVLDRMGLGYERLRTVNPGIVLCSLSGFGQDGPYAHRPGHDLNFLALAGFFAVPHRAGERVDRVGTRVADLTAAMYAALALAVALPGARATRCGQHIDVAAHEAASAWTAPMLLPLRRLATPADSPLVMGDYDLFETADGKRLSLVLFEDRFWLTFRTALAPEFPELGTDAYDSRRERTRHKVAVHALLTRVVAARTLDWWNERLSTVDVPWAPVLDDAAAFQADPHVRARGLVGEASGPGGTTVPQVRFPVRFGAGLDTFRRRAPELGEHTDDVLAEVQTPDAGGTAAT
ncbi:CaiB/BaiF CoA transferase family protein [Micromonospora sp. NPDC047730]|uniref:CaiB/BaiF CoA transferase family protein n=1 Tax=Micromonospora sp. NPDC047730 TaxID=3364253 RepID=UPI00371282D4